jgi:hypothetical protein
MAVRVIKTYVGRIDMCLACDGYPPLNSKAAMSRTAQASLFGLKELPRLERPPFSQWFPLISDF